MVANKDDWKDQLCSLNNFLNTLYVDLFFKMKNIFRFQFQPVAKIVVYFCGSKSDINPNPSFREGNKFTKKVMVSAVVS